MNIKPSVRSKGKQRTSQTWVVKEQKGVKGVNAENDVIHKGRQGFKGFKKLGTQYLVAEGAPSSVNIGTVLSHRKLQSVDAYMHILQIS